MSESRSPCGSDNDKSAEKLSDPVVFVLNFVAGQNLKNPDATDIAPTLEVSAWTGQGYDLGPDSTKPTRMLCFSNLL